MFLLFFTLNINSKLIIIPLKGLFSVQKDVTIRDKKTDPYFHWKLKLLLVTKHCLFSIPLQLICIDVSLCDIAEQIFQVRNTKLLKHLSVACCQCQHFITVHHSHTDQWRIFIRAPRSRATSSVDPKNSKIGPWGTWAPAVFIFHDRFSWLLSVTKEMQ